MEVRRFPTAPSSQGFQRDHKRRVEPALPSGLSRHRRNRVEAPRMPAVRGSVFAQGLWCVRKSNTESEQAGRGGKRGARGRAMASRPSGC